MDCVVGKNKARGFTLIELIVVITILGILAAFAIPRFIALQVQARVSAINSLQGALRSASSLTHGLWTITGGATIPMEGATINMINGYPTYADIPNTLVDASGFTYNVVNGQFSKIGAANPATCSVTYTPPAVMGNAPSIIYDPSDCR